MLLGSVALVFVIARLRGDPVLLMVQPGATAADIAAMRHHLGLDQPLVVQFLHYLGGLLHGDLGVSLWQNTPVLPLTLAPFAFTIKLATLALGLVVVLGVPAGVTAAARSSTGWDQTIVVLAVAGQALPVFWVGLMLMYLLSVQYHVFPVSGVGDWRHLVLPVVTLSLFSIARITRITRSSVLEVLREDYIRTARAKGLARRVVIYRHALRNALLPVLTVVSLDYVAFLGGSVITETIFALPGMGRLAVQAILNRDFPLIQGIALVSSVVAVTINLAVDFIYLAADPRVRYE